MNSKEKIAHTHTNTHGEREKMKNNNDNSKKNTKNTFMSRTNTYEECLKENEDEIYK
jgi:hypothetical protein